ncbi:hypothetical protein [Rhodovulum steppense]|uniref:Uncharacterized protein n=1 Tax=Rhodovulum steppense TaxID=540251 RepID=A0A4R1YC35_9RHOB|nr:hypothetical protein [Rhodovulum steppense]TCM73516.1 hypothetical protein EV216_1495 [Rhodovulum steppense]
MSLDLESTLRELSTALGRAGSTSRGDTVRIQSFVDWCRQQGVPQVDCRLLLAFASVQPKRHALRALETSCKKLLPDGHPFRGVLRYAVQELDRGRRGARTRQEILEGPWWRPLFGKANIDALSYTQLKVVDNHLEWMAKKQISSPTAEDYLAYASNCQSAPPLTSLQAAYILLGLPATPSIVEALPAAITRKRQMTSRPSSSISKPQKVRKLSVSRHSLPPEWQESLADLRKGMLKNSVKAPSRGYYSTVERAVCQYIHACRQNNLKDDFSLEGIQAFRSVLEARKNKNRDLRAATKKMYFDALLRFSRYRGESDELIGILRSASHALEMDFKNQNPLKFGKLQEAGSIQRILSTAIDLKAASRKEHTSTWRSAKINEALALALFAFLPLRLGDTRLFWGAHITFVAGRYFIDCTTRKTGTPISGPLPMFLEPFFAEALLLGVDEVFLDRYRQEAINSRAPLFRKPDGTQRARSFASDAWRKHAGTGMHIARSLVHTELGQLGCKGTAMALSICAQRDPRTARFYQGQAMHDARMLQALHILGSDITEEEQKIFFPDLDSNDESFQCG